MSDGHDLQLIDVGSVNAAKGFWAGYQSAITQWHHRCALAVAGASSWKGDRAERFRSWWTPADADLTTVQHALTGLISALDLYAFYGGVLNSQLDGATILIQENTTAYTALGGNRVTGQFTLPGYQGTTFIVQVSGATLNPSSLHPLVPSAYPTWLSNVVDILNGVQSDYPGYVSACMDALGRAVSQLGHLHQFTELARATAGANETKAGITNPLGDPTWTALTGGNVIRPDYGGFQEDPFGTDLMPSWYDPSTSQKISNVLAEAEPLVDLAAIVLTCLGPAGLAIATGLEVAVHGSKLVVDLADGNTEEVTGDVVDLVLDAGSAGTLASELAERLVYMPLHAASERMTPEVLGKVTDFIQNRLKDAIQENLGPDGKAHIPLDTLSAITSEAQVLVAADLPG